MISYIVVGGCTTLVNLIIYWLLIKLVHQGWLVANVISWIGAVIFAFFANRQHVFKSENDASKEAYQFFMLRLATLVVESALLFIFIQLFSLDEMISKILCQYCYCGF